MTNLNAPLNRWGGDATSRYNWQIDAHSAGADWYFETYSDGSGTPAGSADAYVATTRANPGAEPLFTIPMIDYLANLGPNRSTLEGFSVKKYGAQTATDPYNSDAGNGVSSATGKNITGNNPAGHRRGEQHHHPARLAAAFCVHLWLRLNFHRHQILHSG